MMTTTTCSKDFWDNFLAHYHNQEIFASGPFAQASPLDADALFTTVVDYCRRAQNGQWGVRLFVDGKAWLSGSGLDDVEAARAYFPLPTDSNFVGYHRRMTTLCREYCLIINDPESLDFELYHWCRQFLRPIFQQNGMNNIGIYNALFIGNYAKTSFGVHFDPESIFQFPIVGPKTMRFWSAEYVRDNPDLAESLDYHTHRDAARSLTSHPGEFTYWPKKAWHIAENSGELSVALALSLHEYSDIRPYLVNNLLLPQLSGARKLNDQFELGGRPSAALEVAGVSYSSTPDVATYDVPQVVSQVFQRLSHMTSPSAAAKFWLRLLSAFGFTSPPALQTGEIDRQQRYRLYPDFPVLMQRHDDALYIAANGYLLACPAPYAHIRDFIRYLNTHNELQGAEIYQASHALETDTAKRLLAFLYATRALSPVGASSAID